MEAYHAEAHGREKAAAAARQEQAEMDRVEAEEVRKTEAFEAAAMAWHRSNVLRAYAEHLKTVDRHPAPADQECEHELTTMTHGDEKQTCRGVD
jgi:hypothetical protein